MRAWCLLSCLAGWVCAQEISLPTTDQIHVRVAQLDAQDYPQRMQARADLNAWAEKFPRFMLTRLVEAYAVNENLEITYQLQEMLRTLGTSTLFYQPKAFLGVNFELSHLPDGRSVVYLQSVVPDSPADLAGLKAGDFLLEIGGVPVNTDGDPRAFALQIQKHLPLEGLELRVLRKREFQVEVFLRSTRWFITMQNDLNWRSNKKSLIGWHRCGL